MRRRVRLRIRDFGVIGAAWLLGYEPKAISQRTTTKAAGTKDGAVDPTESVRCAGRVLDAPRLSVLSAASFCCAAVVRDRADAR
jgi:hypothetical protein